MLYFHRSTKSLMELYGRPLAVAREPFFGWGGFNSHFVKMSLPSATSSSRHGHVTSSGGIGVHRRRKYCWAGEGWRASDFVRFFNAGRDTQIIRSIAPSTISNAPIFSRVLNIFRKKLSPIAGEWKRRALLILLPPVPHLEKRKGAMATVPPTPVPKLIG